MGLMTVTDDVFPLLKKDFKATRFNLIDPVLTLQHF